MKNKPEKQPMPAVKKGVMRRVVKELFKRDRGKLIVCLICTLVSAVVGLAASVFIQMLVDDCILPGIQNGLGSVGKRLAYYIGGFGIIYMIGVLAAFLSSRFMAIITMRFLTRIRVNMFDKMESLPIRYFDTKTHGDIMSFYTNDVDTLINLVYGCLPQIVSSAVTIVTMLALMLYYSVWLTLVTLFGAAVSILIAGKVGKRSARHFKAQQSALAETEGYVEEMMHGQKVVKVFNYESRASARFAQINEKWCREAQNANKFANIMGPIMGNIGHLTYVLLAFVGAPLILLGATNVSIVGLNALTVGIVVSFLNMSRSFTMSINQLAQQASSVVMALAGADRIFSLIDEQPETDDGYVTLVNACTDGDTVTETEVRTEQWAWKHPHGDGTVTYTPLTGHIEFFDVDFGYTEDKIVLHDVRIDATPGQKIAFVGATGAGKTTITNLINRFYDLADGKIRYDGININKISKADLRRSLGIVLQDTCLFSGTVMDNIRYGRLDATDAECIAAAKLANAHDFITRLPEGYQTMLTSDGGLSQGQRQLLAIARAAVADAPVMIMDEATSSIDTRTEALVQKGTDRLMEGRTVFVIAHRLSTVRNADVIIVLDHGRIIEQGSHEQLLAQKGQYYKLYTGAFELE